MKYGIEVLLSSNKKWLVGKRVGLVSHIAAVDSKGVSTAELLWKDKDVNLTALLGPEHGFFGKAAPGAVLKSGVHPEWSIPLYSLYGKTKKPTVKMLRNLDVLIYDIQDLCSRPYTYVSTLRYVVESCAETGTELIIADRPVPYPNIIDGPVTEKKFSSFVSLIEAPMVYGMTPGETALWLKKKLNLKVNIKIAKMSGYKRQAKRGKAWPRWVPASPAIRTWESAQCFPVLVFAEALQSIDHARATKKAFQFFGAEWINGPEAAGCLRKLKLPGVKFESARYKPDPRDKKIINGVRVTVVNANTFCPVLASVSIIYCLQELYGVKAVWAKGKTRSAFFDKLYGTDSVRKALRRGETPGVIAAEWRKGLVRFQAQRERVLLY